MSSLESFIEKTKGAASVDALFQMLQEALDEEGYDRILFALLSDHHELGMKPGIGIIQNYPADWMNFYFENRLDRVDPIPRFAAQRLEAFSWLDVEKHLKLTPQQKKCLAQGREAGLNHGVGVPLHGPHGEIAGISVATSENKRSCALNRDLLTAYCNQFYLVFKRLHKLPEPEPCNMYLTSRERDILSWIAKGKTEAQVADRLAISPDTVNMAMRKLYVRFGVKSRVVVVVKALHHGLLDL